MSGLVTNYELIYLLATCTQFIISNWIRASWIQLQIKSGIWSISISLSCWISVTLDKLIMGSIFMRHWWRIYGINIHETLMTYSWDQYSWDMKTVFMVQRSRPYANIYGDRVFTAVTRAEILIGLYYYIDLYKRNIINSSWWFMWPYIPGVMVNSASWCITLVIGCMTWWLLTHCGLVILYMPQWSGSKLALVMASCLTAPELMLTYHQWGLLAFTWG